MDNDIKIFGAPEQHEDLESVAAETEALRESGRLDRAKRLGRELAGLSAQSPEMLAIAESFGFSLTPARVQQLQVLMVFSGQHALRELLAPPLLAEASITAMNNFLINRSRTFWDTISDGSAFTQYLLAERVNAPHEEQAGLIGGVFAYVCGQEDNEDLHHLGATVFTTAHEFVEAKWEPVE